MSLRIKALCAAFLLLPLAGCGFKPVYGEKEQSSPLQAMAGVRIREAGRQYTDQLFQQSLEDRLNPGGVPANAPYQLEYTLAMSESPIGVTRDGTVLRYNISMDASYKLIRIDNNLKITQGAVRHVSSYNNPIGKYYSTFVSKEDAVHRGIGELSEMIRTRLAPFLVQKNPKPADQAKPLPVPGSPLNQPVFNRPDLAPKPIE